MHTPADAPPFIRFCSPYGGLGLKTKSYAAARARIDGLLATATEVVLREAELTVAEPCTRALAETLAGETIGPNTASIGKSGTRADLPAMVAAAGHALDTVSAEAWRRFGPPNQIEVHQEKGGFHVGWCWKVESDPALAPDRVDAWSPFVAEHQHLMMNDYSTRLGVRAIWNFRLAFAGGPFAEPFPTSEIMAHLRGKHASAFLDLVFGYSEPTPAFVADLAAAKTAMGGLALPAKSFRLSAPKKQGGGRVLKKLPPF